MRIESGRKVLMGYIHNAHKRGKLCLRCGKYVDKLKCEDCEPLERCKMCHVVCRPGEYRVYTYGKTRGNPLEATEYYEVHEPLCRVLIDGLCETCVNWEEEKRNVCWFCKSDFLNTFSNYRDNGNICKTCSGRLHRYGENYSRIFDENGDYRGGKISTDEIELSTLCLPEEE